VIIPQMRISSDVLTVLFLSEVEFWLGKPSRLHDRVRYLRVEGSDNWQIDRLSP
jgi:pyridoxine/pyridoxamine 5'-phosphate oxidase